ncbi:hypothetical protein ACFRQM_33365, partial [Streptomyces sp. NPDC056831]
MAGEYQGVDRPVHVVTVTGWISGLDLGNIGCLIVGLFVPVWAVAPAYWKIANRRQRLTPTSSEPVGDVVGPASMVIGNGPGPRGEFTPRGPGPSERG